MVKNTVGGGKGKKIARKLTTSYVFKESTRFSTNELEQYALVTKIYGNGRCQVKTHDGLDIQCVIRNKFKGRSKRGNVVTNGSYILIGLREWETASGHKTSDLLEIYDAEDVTVLQNQPLFKKLVASTAEKHGADDGLFLSSTECENTYISSHAAAAAAAESDPNPADIPDSIDFNDI